MLNELTFDELSNCYQNKNYRCGSTLSYSPKNNTITHLGCNQWICKKCRSHKVSDLYQLVLMAMYRYDLTRHLVITFPGKDLRSQYSYQQSYGLMTYDWKKFIQTLKYKLQKNNQLTNDFGYMRFSRAQQDGYCHDHVLLNQWIDKKLIDKIIEDNDYHFGYSSIQFNQDLADYLRDFKKDREYYIPVQLKHYSTSRNIIVDPGQGIAAADPDSIRIHHMSYEQIDKLIEKRYNQIAPFEIYVQWFQDVINTPQKIIGGQYVNGVLKKPYIRKNENYQN